MRVNVYADYEMNAQTKTCVDIIEYAYVIEDADTKEVIHRFSGLCGLKYTSSLAQHVIELTNLRDENLLGLPCFEDAFCDIIEPELRDYTINKIYVYGNYDKEVLAIYQHRMPYLLKHSYAVFVDKHSDCLIPLHIETGLYRDSNTINVKLGLSHFRYLVGITDSIVKDYNHGADSDANDLRVIYNSVMGADYKLDRLGYLHNLVESRALADSINDYIWRRIRIPFALPKDHAYIVLLDNKITACYITGPYGYISSKKDDSDLSRRLAFKGSVIGTLKYDNNGGAAFISCNVPVKAVHIYVIDSDDVSTLTYENDEYISSNVDAITRDDEILYGSDVVKSFYNKKYINGYASSLSCNDKIDKVHV